MITAEVTPKDSKTTEAALALQNMGFEVLHIGQSITIKGEQSLFEETFSVKLVKKSRDVMPDLLKNTKTEFFESQNRPIIPEGLKSLMEDIVFPEPANLF